MKIVQIRFKNLNSLTGEWNLDFSHHAFEDQGIFAITGPTGAGKTTILDALCLALYGRTPRLARITKSSNELMSRQTGECFAEVVVQTQAGLFRCHWSQRRARKNPQGELQDPRHEIADAQSGKILDSTIKTVAARVEAVTGMDFDRFTRSVLLAQGGFAAFLQANPDERAPILEQITGTELYSHISMRVHERLRAEQDKLRACEEEIAGIALLSADEEQEITQRLAACQQRDTDVRQAMATTSQAIAWLTTIERLRQDLETLDTEAQTVQQRYAAFAPDRARLALARAASTLEGMYAALTTRRAQQAEDHQALLAVRATLPEHTKKLDQQAAVLARAEEATVQAKAALHAAGPLLRTVRALDLGLAEKKKTLAEQARTCQQLEQKRDALTQAGRTVQAQKNTATKQLHAVQTYLSSHAHDAWLVGNLAAVTEQCATMQAMRQTRETTIQALAAARQRKAKTEAALSLCHKQCTAQALAVQTAKQELKVVTENLNALLAGRLVREYRARKETLLREMVLLRRIAELEEHRSRLEDGHPCPLCGALDHPYAHGNVPMPDALEEEIAALATLIEKAERYEEQKEVCMAKERVAQNALVEREKNEVQARHEVENAEQDCITLTSQVQQLDAQYAAHIQALADKLAPLGFAVQAESALGELGRELQARLDTWMAKTAQLSEIERSMQEMHNALIQTEARSEEIRTALEAQRAQYAALEKDYAADLCTRQELFAAKNPDTEEMNLHTAVSCAEDTEKKAKLRVHELQHALSDAQARATTLHQRREKNVQELRELESEFVASVNKCAFADEAAFCAARMSEAERNSLEEKAKSLEAQKIDINAKHADRAARLHAELEKKQTTRSLEELMAEQAGYEKEGASLHEHITELTMRMRHNIQAKEQVRKKHAALEAQRALHHTWAHLHGLIGSADGKKYRNFVQGLTFERMVRHANVQLQKMTDRYLLLRTEAQPLELAVMDLYQAGEIRSAKNLSGGESFLVSLALALGLAHMASTNVRVDSLFLDEGFGTLDDEALETALETLASLHEQGKIIGVISHIQALKDRISTQIEVIPHTGGRSRIVGPGCTEL
ncbi:AAA family ATPase [Desulfovibrionales bacterium]